MRITQRLRLKKIKKKVKKKAPALNCCPQRRAVCIRLFFVSPKKPNSARRKVARVAVFPSRRELTAYIPGERHTIQQFANVLIRGGRTPDVPGLRYKIIRGTYDVRSVETRQRARSKYGTKRQETRIRVFFGKKKGV